MDIPTLADQHDTPPTTPIPTIDRMRWQALVLEHARSCRRCGVGPPCELMGALDRARAAPLVAMEGLPPAHRSRSPDQRLRGSDAGVTLLT
jgi:hypothetical protein